MAELNWGLLQQRAGDRNALDAFNDAIRLGQGQQQMDSNALRSMIAMKTARDDRENALSALVYARGRDAAADARAAEQQSYARATAAEQSAYSREQDQREWVRQGQQDTLAAARQDLAAQQQATTQQWAASKNARENAEFTQKILRPHVERMYLPGQMTHENATAAVTSMRESGALPKDVADQALSEIPKLTQAGLEARVGELAAASGMDAGTIQKSREAQGGWEAKLAAMDEQLAGLNDLATELSDPVHTSGVNATGPVQDYIPNVYESTARLHGKLKSAAAQIALTKSEAMKGSMTDADREMLESSIAALGTNQGIEQLKENVETIRGVTQRTRDRTAGQYGVPAAAPAVPATRGGGGKRISAAAVRASATQRGLDPATVAQALTQAGWTIDE
jgi:hypothetical protein